MAASRLSTPSATTNSRSGSARPNHTPPPSGSRRRKEARRVNRGLAAPVGGEKGLVVGDRRAVGAPHQRQHRRPAGLRRPVPEIAGETQRRRVLRRESPRLARCNSTAVPAISGEARRHAFSGSRGGGSSGRSGLRGSLVSVASPVSVSIALAKLTPSTCIMSAMTSPPLAQWRQFQIRFLVLTKNGLCRRRLRRARTIRWRCRV